MERAEMDDRVFEIFPVGFVRKRRGNVKIEISKPFLEGLEGIEAFSQIIVLWWFDRNDSPDKRSILKVHPMGDKSNPLRGVFATRSPVRPNLLGLSVCRLLDIRGSVLKLDAIDAFDGTPVIDIKPCSTEEGEMIGKRLA